MSFMENFRLGGALYADARPRFVCLALDGDVVSAGAQPLDQRLRCRLEKPCQCQGLSSSQA